MHTCRRSESTRPAAGVDGRRCGAVRRRALRWQSAARIEPAADGSSARERILVVDDNAAMRDYLQQLLADWDVDVATDGTAALEMASARAPDVDAARLTAEALEAVGHETRVAFDGPAALQVAAEFQPDLALLDLGLPLMDGYEVARQLVDAQRDRRLVLIAVTGYGQASDRERTTAAGFQAHVVKPVDIAHLVDLIDRLLVAERTQSSP